MKVQEAFEKVISELESAGRNREAQMLRKSAAEILPAPQPWEAAQKVYSQTTAEDWASSGALGWERIAQAAIDAYKARCGEVEYPIRVIGEPSGYLSRIKDGDSVFTADEWEINEWDADLVEKLEKDVAYKMFVRFEKVEK